MKNPTSVSLQDFIIVLCVCTHSVLYVHMYQKPTRIRWRDRSVAWQARCSSVGTTTWTSDTFFFFAGGWCWGSGGRLEPGVLTVQYCT